MQAVPTPGLRCTAAWRMRCSWQRQQTRQARLLARQRGWRACWLQAWAASSSGRRPCDLLPLRHTALPSSACLLIYCWGILLYFGMVRLLVCMLMMPAPPAVGAAACATPVPQYLQRGHGIAQAASMSAGSAASAEPRLPPCCMPAGNADKPSLLQRVTLRVRHGKLA